MELALLLVHIVRSSLHPRVNYNSTRSIIMWISRAMSSFIGTLLPSFPRPSWMTKGKKMIQKRAHGSLGIIIRRRTNTSENTWEYLCIYIIVVRIKEYYLSDWINNKRRKGKTGTNNEQWKKEMPKEVFILHSMYTKETSSTQHTWDNINSITVKGGTHTGQITYIETFSSLTSPIHSQWSTSSRNFVILFK